MSALGGSCCRVELNVIFRRKTYFTKPQLRDCLIYFVQQSILIQLEQNCFDKSPEDLRLRNNFSRKQFFSVFPEAPVGNEKLAKLQRAIRQAAGNRFGETCVSFIN